MKRFRKLTLASMVAVGLTGAWPPVSAQDAPQRFYEGKAQGWFWYAVDLEPEQEPEPESVKPPPAAPVAVAAPPTLPPGPTPFSAQWFRENLPKYKDAAWDNPTVENLKAFYYLQRYAMDQSERFANAAEMAVVGDPFLDEVSRRPAATFASQRVDTRAGQERDNLLGAVSQRTGLFFFFKGDEYGNLQAPIVKAIERSGYAVVPVSVDGVPLKDGVYANARPDQGRSKILGIQSFPAIYLVSPDGVFEPVSQGMISLPELTHRILIAAKRNGWVTDDEYNKTKPLLNADSSIVERLDVPTVKQAVAATATEAGDTKNFIPPDKLLGLIKTRLKGR